MARESGVVASMLLIAVASDAATAGHPMTGHDRTFSSNPSASWQRCDLRPVTNLCWRFAHSRRSIGGLATGASRKLRVGRERTRTQSVAAPIRISSITLDPPVLCACEQLDSVTICTPNEAHSRHALLALNHDKRVSGEKPHSLTVSEAPRPRCGRGE
jgi:hypothetical protein